MGKTALGINIAYNICKSLNENIIDKKQKKAVGFISLEMSSEQLSARILSMETSINSMKFRTGMINDADMECLIHRSKEISEMPFFIDDTPALSIGAVRTRVRRMVRKNNLSFVVIDYLQLLRGSSKRSSENRVQEISEITQGLKSIAKEFNIPVLALSQLSRAVEQREDKRPQLSDLRESGSIEQDADIVIFIYRESYYCERERPTDESSEKFENWQNKMKAINNEVDIIIAKQRNGPIGNVKLYFEAEYTRFANYDSAQRMEHAESLKN
jgi:replicative DNA helicase